MKFSKVISRLKISKPMLQLPFRKSQELPPLPTEPLPLYRICSCSCSFPNTYPPCFQVRVRFRGRLFSVVVDLLELRNSPDRVREFQRFYHQIASGEICDCESDDDEEDCDAPYVHGVGPYDCFKWAVEPCLTAFKTKAPPLADDQPLTLEQRHGSEVHQCRLKAVDNCLEPGVLFVIQAGNSPVSESPSTSLVSKRPAISSIFPCFSLSQIEYEEEDQYSIFDQEPRLIRVSGQEYVFKSYAAELDCSHAMQEVCKHERLSEMLLPDEVRYWRLFGVAQDPHGSVIGLLFHKIPGMLLREAMERWHKTVIRGQWEHKIKTTVDALHANQISWGHATLDNIVVDEEGDPWLTDFATGDNEEWIPMDSSAAIAADRIGLGEVMKYMDGLRYESYS